jgi:hypothetical protein
LDTKSLYWRAIKKAFIGLFACFTLAFVLFVVYPISSEGISDDVAYRKIHPGQTRRDVERAIPDWTPQTIDSDGRKGFGDQYARQYPGYCIVRYQWWLDIYVDVYYDGKNRVFMTQCNG